MDQSIPRFFFLLVALCRVAYFPSLLFCPLPHLVLLISRDRQLRMASTTVNFGVMFAQATAYFLENSESSTMEAVKTLVLPGCLKSVWVQCTYRLSHRGLSWANHPIPDTDVISMGARHGKV